MRDISRTINLYTGKLQETCQFHEGERECSREEGCVCRKLGEIKALTQELIEPIYRNSTFDSFTGKLPDGQRAKPFRDDPNRINEVKKQLWKYLYGDTPMVPGGSREDYNRISIIDKRHREGASVVIHGKSGVYKKEQHGGYRYEHVPTGKTLLASIIMLDAINRNKHPSGKNWTYDKVSFLELRQALKSKDDSIYDMQDVDWLLIDDLVEIAEEGSSKKASGWTKEVFDAFLIDRIQNHKPTILVCNFDIEDISVEERMGLAFQKILSSHTTHEIKV